MSRYIDADALINQIIQLQNEIDKEIQKAKQKPKHYSPKFIEGSVYQNMAISHVIQQIMEQPTADVVEVVRCRDCTWWKSIFSWNGKEHKVCVSDACEPSRDADDYCSYGERREDVRESD